MTFKSTAEALQTVEINATLPASDERSVYLVDPIDSSSNRAEGASGTGGNYRAKQAIITGAHISSKIPPAHEERFEVIKHWEGVVTAVDQESFVALLRIVDSLHSVPDSQIEIDLDNVPNGDRALVQEGAIFYLTVGTRYPTGGRPEKTSRLVFRRMPRWSAGDIQRSDAIADDLWRKLNSKSKLSIDGSSPEYGNSKIEGNR